MSLDVRPDSRMGGTGEEKFYSPGRDLVYLMPELIHQILMSMKDGDKWLDEYLNQGGSVKDLEYMAKCMAKFIELTHTERDATVCYELSGLDTVSPAVIDLFGRRIFRAFLGVFHKGYGRITFNERESPIDLKAYSKAAMEAVEYWTWMESSWWRKLKIRVNRLRGRTVRQRAELW